MAEAVGYAILGRIGANLVDPIGRQFGYLFCFNRNIQNLQTQHDVLKATREGVQLGVNEARNNMRIVEPLVEAWLNNANTKIEEAETTIASKARVQTGCLKGWCWPRYSLGRKAAKMTQDLVDLCTERIKYTQLSHSPPPPSIQSLPSTGFKGFESRNLIVKQIIDALKDDEINLVGLCGMGGVGKTTMVNHVAKRVKEEEKLFDEVAMAVVSQEPNLKQVQSCIANMLGLKLDDKENPSPIARASLLHKRLLLDNKKILVILDDIWEEFELEELGFPLEGGSNKSCKILFTSRNRNLWKGIPNKRYIQLEVLVGEEPWHLFREKVGVCADGLDLLPLAKQIVNECGGLPLALVTIGTALSNEHDQRHWNDALRQLRTPCSESLLSEVPAKVYQALYFSYNFLKGETAKKLFLFCCLFPEDYEIPIEDLVRYGIGLRWFEGIDKVDEVRDRVNVLVDQLKSCYLLLDGDEGEGIKMHDVVRDVAISIAAKDKHGFMTIHGAKSREWPKKVTYELNTSISVVSDEIAEFPGGLRCSKLEFLLIQCCNSSLKIPSNFFEGMGELKVLNLRITYQIPLLPSSLQFLSNLLTLHLNLCQKFDNISVIGKLLNLEILSFLCSDIEELPEEIGGLVNLKLLDLTNCYKLKKIAPGVISALVQLQELYMGGCKIIWEREGKEGGENASLREFESLSNLNTLEINIEDVKCLPRIPLFSKLTKYSICIGFDEGRLFHASHITSVGKLLKLCGQCTIPSECVNSLLRSSAVLELRGMGSQDAVQELFREGVEGLQHLKDLVIDDCATPECFVNTMEWVPRTPNAIPPIFPILEKLGLGKLPVLRKICHCQLPTGSFAKLKRLTIKDCDRMEEVIWKEKGEDDATNKMEFPALESMTLERLPMLIGFCRGTDEIEFPQLKKLRLRQLPQLKWLFLNSSNPFSESMENHNATFLSLFPHKVALPSLEELELKDLDNLEGLEHIPISVGSFSKLRKVHVERCGKWLCVFPSQFLTRLRNVEDLTVENCSLLEKVFESEMVDESKMLSLLKSLKLKHLPQLDYISKRDPIGFTYISQLSILHVHDCDNLRYLFPHSMMKCMLQLQELDIRRCKMISRVVVDEKGQGKSSVDKIEFTQLKILRLYDLPNLVSFFSKVIATSTPSTERHQNVMQTLFNEKVVFPTLEVLELDHLDNLEGMGHSPSSMSFSKLRSVHVRHCGKLLKVFQAQLLSRLQNLQKLSIKDCSLLEKVFELEVVDCTEHNSKIFPLLKSLKLESLPQLNHISERDSIGFMYIPQLSILHIDGCDNLRFLFTQSMTQSIRQLQELEIRECKMMSAIAREEDSQGEILVDKTEFTQLKILKLYDLQNLVSIFPKVTSTMVTSFEHIQNPGQSLFNEKVAFPSLEELELHGFQNMNEIWCNQLQTGSFNKLIKLYVSDCGSLRNMFSPFMARHLVHLKILTIKRCWMMEEVVAKEEDEEDEEGRINRTPLPKLEYLKLKDLPECSECFVNTMEWVPRTPNAIPPIFPILEELKLDDLHNLRKICHCQLPTGSFGKLKHLTIKDCDRMEEVIWKEKGEDDATNKMEFPALESINLYFLPMLIGFCRGTDEIEFPQLKKLSLKNLPQFKWLFLNSSNPFSESMENHNATFLSLFPHKEKGEDDATNKMEFPALESVTLWSLPMFIGFCRGIDEIEFPQLKELSLRKLPQLKWLFLNSSNPFSESMENHNATFISLFHHKVALPSLEELELEDLDNLEGLGHIPISVGSSFPKLRKLSVEHCGKWLYVSPSQFLTRLPNLQKLSIRDCSLLEELADCTEHNSKIFPLLKSLKLKSPPQLNHISERDPIGLMYIPRLSILHIDDFDNLRFLFSQSMTQCILQLQELEIRGCKMMSTIFREEDSHGEILVDNIEFTQLKILRLHDLQNLVSIFPKVTTTVATSSEHIQNPGQSLFNEKVAFPSLEELELHGFQNMNQIWCNQLQAGSFNKLFSLDVSNCGSLRNMFSPFMARHLVHLKRLVIKKCRMMEEVVAKEEDEEDEEGRINRTPLPKLESLKLGDLPELKSFCHVTHNWKLPLVDDVTVFNCPKMKTFSPGVICTPKLQRVFVKEWRNKWSPGIEGEDWLSISDLNQTITHLIEKHDLADDEGENEETCETSDDGDGYEETRETSHDGDGDDF